MIYIVRAATTGMIKIGYTEDEATFYGSRLRSLRTGSGDRLEVLKLMPGDMAAEKELHERFCRWRAHGEWFHPNRELHEFAGYEEKLELLHPIVGDAWRRGYEQRRRDVEAAVVHRTEDLRAELQRARADSRRIRTAYASEGRAHEETLLALADDYGIDLEAWTAERATALVNAAFRR